MNKNKKIKIDLKNNTGKNDCIDKESIRNLFSDDEEDDEVMDEIEEIEEIESSDEEITDDEYDDNADSSDNDNSNNEFDFNDDLNLQDVSDEEKMIDSNSEISQDEYFKNIPQNNSENVSDEKAKVKFILNKLESVPLNYDKFVVNDEYAYNSSDEEDVLNTIGNIPYEWYKDYVHIGYDVNGRKIIQPPSEDEVKKLLNEVDPDNWRTIKDKSTGQKVILSDEDVNIVKRVGKGNCPDSNYNLYEPFIDIFSYKKLLHPVTNRPEPKAVYIPSISEKRLVSKFVSAIKKARLKPKPIAKKPKQFEFSYDLWEKDDKTNKRLDRYIAAPKLQPPGHEESYNPPVEYLFNEEEEEQFKNEDPEDQKNKFIPRKYRTLREVPAYKKFTQELLERSFNLYLCPRVKRNRIQINAEDLLPELPKPSDLQPFPTVQSIVYKGHESNVLCLCVEPCGQFIASGDNSGMLKIWEVLSGRCFISLQFYASITCISWSPIASRSFIAIVINKSIYIIKINLGNKQVNAETEKYFSELTMEDKFDSNENKSVCTWKKLSKNDESNWVKGVRIIIQHESTIKQLTWHSAGDYFAAIMPSNGNKSIIMHHLTKMQSQVPFKRIKDEIISVQFHPTKAYFFVSSKRSIRVYNLIKQELTKKLIANCNEISCLAIHPEGDNIIVGSLDPRVQWFDLDLSVKAYRTMRYHEKSVRSVDFHRKYPLFASSSDDGKIVVCHGMVYNDLAQNALIVPVKVLIPKKTHKEEKTLEIPKCIFHPERPWLFAITSNTIRLFT